MTGLPPTWTILIPTLGERHRLFLRLLDGLLPQIDPFEGRVRVMGWHNDGTPPLPLIRQRMIQRATTEYVSFIDDDDVVAPYFVDEVMTALESWPDYVGFQVQCYSDGRPTGISHHSLEFSRWRNPGDGRFERDISHINPMRTKIAQSADFTKTPRGRAEDRIWVDQLRRGRLLKEQVFIPRIMYHYLYSTSRSPGLGSRWQHPGAIHKGATAATAVASPHFIWSHRG